MHLIGMILHATTALLFLATAILNAAMADWVLAGLYLLCVGCFAGSGYCSYLQMKREP